MIDSINFLAYDIGFINFNYLRMLGVEIEPYTIFDRIGNSGRGYSFTYKGVQFKFNSIYRCVLIKTNTHDLLNKRDITLGDKETYKEKLNDILKTVFGTTNINLKIERVDYYVDVPLEENQKNMYLALFNNYMPNFAYTKKKTNYASSVYRASKRGQYNINIYSRFEKTKNCLDNGILRIELQMKKPKIKNEAKKGVPRKLDSYWNIEAMEKYYFDFYRPFFGIGNHYRIEKAREIINHSKLSDSWKKKLKKFLKDMMYEVDYKRVIKSKQTFRSYADKLGKLGINVLCIWDCFSPEISSLPNLLDLAKAMAKDKYFK